MLSTTLLLAAVLMPQGGSSNAPVCINEFSYDDSSTDDVEFVELFNRSGAPVDISGWTLVGDDFNGPNFTTTFPSGTVLSPGAFLVVGNAAVPNVDIVESGGFLQNSDESITLFDTSGRTIDTLLYESNKGVFNSALVEGEGVWGNAALIQGAGEMCWARHTDGYDTDDNGDDFRLQRWTPGSSNNQPYLAPSLAIYDTATVGNDADDWVGSFVNPRIIDPTVADGNNPNAIPASPQGGNAAIAWDPSGGGNVAAHVSAPGSRSTFECYIYIDGNPLAVAGNQETWSVGFGTCATFYNTPDPSGALGFTANGLTGVSWTFQRTDSTAELYLIDHNNGGWGTGALTGPTILGQITLVPGQNDGWQRVLITVDNGNITGRFGGNYGAPDGTVFTGTTNATPRGFHIGYREFVSDNTTTRPVTIDALRLAQCPAASSRVFGTSVDTSTGSTPTLAALGQAILGGNLQLGAQGHLPSAPAFGLFGLELGSPVTFGALTNPGVGLWVNAFASLGVGVDANGRATLSLPIASDPTLCGAEVSWQVLQFDSGQTGGLLGFNQTAGLVTRVGL